MSSNLELLEKLFDAKLQPLTSDMAEIKNTLNGSDKSVGLVGRVDRIEQKIGYAIAVVSFLFVTSFELAKEFFMGKIKT